MQRSEWEAAGTGVLPTPFFQRPSVPQPSHRKSHTCDTSLAVKRSPRSRGNFSADTMNTVNGRLRDVQFRSRRNFILYAVNSIACENIGIVKDLHELYPYEGAYTNRQRMYTLSRATLQTRDEPGRIIVHEPPESSDSPHLIACVTQFGYGEPIERNQRARQAVTTSQDRHYVEGLKEDTQANRRRYFQACLKNVAVLAMGHREVEKIYIPEGLACSGRTGEEWEHYYLPAINDLSLRLQPFGIEVFLVKLPDK